MNKNKNVDRFYYESDWFSFLFSLLLLLEWDYVRIKNENVLYDFNKKLKYKGWRLHYLCYISQRYYKIYIKIMQHIIYKDVMVKG